MIISIPLFNFYVKIETRKSNVIFTETITALFIILFVYTATSKLLDYDHFRIELGKSPLLAGLSGVIAWVLPIFELSIAVLLATRKWRLLGLYLSFVLMTLFTAYLITILHFSEFVPCTCGGFIEKMNWNQHIVFNLVFIVFSFMSVVIYPNNTD